MNKQNKINLITILMIMVSVIYYIIPVRQSVLLELVTRFYYVPIILGALWFGRSGGIGFSLLVSFTCLPHIISAMGQDRSLFYDELLELVMFNVVGALVGILNDRYRRQRDANQRLQVLASLGETMVSVSHDMKNILIPIRGFIRRIRANNYLEDKTVSYLDIIESGSAKLEKMTKDMLSFARFAPLKLREIEVNELLESTRGLLANEFDESGVQLIFQCRCKGLRLNLDKDKIQNALLNLLQNALHASQKGGIVRLLAECMDGSFRIMIEDEGNGIEPDVLKKIFTLFFTTKPQGTGLGLSITRRVVKEHGGRIDVDSVPGRGTCFSILLPLRYC